MTNVKDKKPKARTARLMKAAESSSKMRTLFVGALTNVVIEKGDEHASNIPASMMMVMAVDAAMTLLNSACEVHVEKAGLADNDAEREEFYTMIVDAIMTAVGRNLPFTIRHAEVGTEESFEKVEEFIKTEIKNVKPDGESVH